MRRREIIRWSTAVMGVALSGSLSRALMADVSITAARADTVFAPPQRSAVNLLADMIIPETDTPGAVAAGVPDFIASIFRDWYTDTEREIFSAGLDALDQYCQAEGGTPFHDADPSTRRNALLEQERIAAEYQPPQGGFALRRPKSDETAPFFTKIRELVVLGYYTSELGATTELAYRPVPGEYNGDYDFDKVGRQWSH